MGRRLARTETEKSMAHKHKVGDELYFVASRRTANRMVKIKAVGRIWVTIDVANEVHHFAINDAGMEVMIPSYGSVGKCFVSEQAWLDEKALDVAWSALRAAVSGAYCKPEGLTVESISEARKLLCIGGVKA